MNIFPNREDVALVRGGDERDVNCLSRLGGQIIERGKRRDHGGMSCGYALVRFGKRPGGPRQHDTLQRRSSLPPW
jgi:hypothetical protein